MLLGFFGVSHHILLHPKTKPLTRFSIPSSLMVISERRTPGPVVVGRWGIPVIPLSFHLFCGVDFEMCDIWFRVLHPRFCRVGLLQPPFSVHPLNLLPQKPESITVWASYSEERGGKPVPAITLDSGQSPGTGKSRFFGYGARRWEGLVWFWSTGKCEHCSL